MVERITTCIKFIIKFNMIYNIENTVNLDDHPCFKSEKTYPNFQPELNFFKTFLIDSVNQNKSFTFYKFGDGDYYFLKADSVGSAAPGKRALSKPYSQINHSEFVNGSKLCDIYTCEIYPENRERFRRVISRNIDYPAEYCYGLVSNKWLLKQFAGKIGLIGGNNKINIIRELMKYPQYQEYLGIEQFNDYICIPEKFACDDIAATEHMVGEQLKTSSSKIFLMGIGHVKSALTHRLPKYSNAIFLDVGSSIDALAGIIDIRRPYFGDWTNYQIKNPNLYSGVDYLQYKREGKHIFLENI
jgi:hypothetical protein